MPRPPMNVSLHVPQHVNQIHNSFMTGAGKLFRSGSKVQLRHRGPRTFSLSLDTAF